MSKVTVTRSAPVIESITLELSVEEAAYVYACLGQFASWKLRGREPGFDVYYQIGTALARQPEHAQLAAMSARLVDHYSITDRRKP